MIARAEGLPVVNVAAYKFVDIDDPQALAETLRSRAVTLDLRGTILIAEEGINLSIAGAPGKVESFLSSLALDERFADLPLKRSESQAQPFKRMRVKRKRETVAMKRPEIRPSRQPAPRLAPKTLRRWLDEGKPVVLLDTRNRFEVELGSFEQARSLDLKSFSEFPAQAARLDPALKDLPVVTFCTGGIRCEKAAPYLIELGFRKVYQLDGGILGYFEACGAAHFEGRCFVFDERVAVDADSVIPSVRKETRRALASIKD